MLNGNKERYVVNYKLEVVLPIKTEYKDGLYAEIHKIEEASKE